MKLDKTNALIRILASALKAVPLDKIDCAALDAETITEVYRLSKLHDVAHIAGVVLKEAGLLAGHPCASKFEKQQAMATYRCLGMQLEAEQIYALFEEAKIPYMPLKGAVIRAYYPTPEMRTSSDIDILVHPEDLERAVDLLVKRLEYTAGEKNVHDVSLFSPGGVHLELHFSLADNDPTLDAVLLGAWDLADRADEDAYCYHMSREMFYVYCVAHMAKHFIGGGCGIRPVMDLYIIQSKMEYDTKKANELLEVCGMLRFAEQAQLLSDIWFAGKEHSALTLTMQDYILESGVFGKEENKIAIASAKQGSRFKYAMGRIFLSRNILRLSYPALEKHSWLYPYYLVKRWFRVLVGKDRKGAIKELKQTATVEETKKAHLAALCQALELI